MILLQVAVFCICLSGAFFFAGSETGFISWNPLKIGHRAGQGDIVAKWALYLMNHKGRLISAVLIGNNVCVIGATLAFLTIFDAFDRSVSFDLSLIPSPESWILTPVMVLFGEMLPKSLFRTYPFRLTMRSVPFLMVIYYITLPLTWVFTFFTTFLERFPGEREQSFLTRVREEMVLIALEGSKRGTLFESADVFMSNILKLKDRTFTDIMNRISDFRSGNHIFTVTDTVSNVKKSIPSAEEIVVFDSSGSVPEGTVSLLNIINAADNIPLGKIINPLKNFDQSMSLITGLQKIDESSHRYFVITDQDRVVGILDKMELFRAIFGGISPDFKIA